MFIYGAKITRTKKSDSRCCSFLFLRSGYERLQNKFYSPLTKQECLDSFEHKSAYQVFSQKKSKYDNNAQEVLVIFEVELSVDDHEQYSKLHDASVPVSKIIKIKGCWVGDEYTPIDATLEEMKHYQTQYQRNCCAIS